MNVIKKVQNFASCVQIAHHIPGRIRLRLASAEDAALLAEPPASLLAQLRDFKAILASTPGIRLIKVNLLARSCTVEYDPAVIPFQAWQDFLRGVHSEDANLLTRIVEEKCLEVICA